MQEIPLPQITPTTGPSVRIGAPVRSPGRLGSLEGLSQLAGVMHKAKLQENAEAADLAFRSNTQGFMDYLKEVDSPEARAVRKEVEAGNIPRTAVASYWGRVESLAAENVARDYAARLESVAGNRETFVNPDTGLPRKDLKPEELAKQIWADEFGGGSLESSAHAAAVWNQLLPQIESNFSSKVGLAIDNIGAQWEDSEFTGKVSDVLYRGFLHDSNFDGTEVEELSKTIDAYFATGLPNVNKRVYEAVEITSQELQRIGGVAGAQAAADFLDTMIGAGEKHMGFKFDKDTATMLLALEDKVDADLQQAKTVEAQELGRTRVRMDGVLTLELTPQIRAAENDPNADLGLLRESLIEQVTAMGERAENPLTPLEQEVLLESVQARLDTAQRRQVDQLRVDDAFEERRYDDALESLKFLLRTGKVTPDDALTNLRVLDEQMGGFPNFEEARDIIESVRTDASRVQDPLVIRGEAAVEEAIAGLPEHLRAPALKELRGAMNALVTLPPDTDVHAVASAYVEDKVALYGQQKEQHELRSKETYRDLRDRALAFQDPREDIDAAFDGHLITPQQEQELGSMAEARRVQRENLLKGEEVQKIQGLLAQALSPSDEFSMPDSALSIRLDNATADLTKELEEWFAGPGSLIQDATEVTRQFSEQARLLTHQRLEAELQEQVELIQAGTVEGDLGEAVQRLERARVVFAGGGTMEEVVAQRKNRNEEIMRQLDLEREVLDEGVLPVQLFLEDPFVQHNAPQEIQRLMGEVVEGKASLEQLQRKGLASLKTKEMEAFPVRQANRALAVAAPLGLPVEQLLAGTLTLEPPTADVEKRDRYEATIADAGSYMGSPQFRARYKAAAEPVTVEFNPDHLGLMVDAYNAPLLFPGEGTPQQNFRAEMDRLRAEGGIDAVRDLAEMFGVEGPKEAIEEWIIRQDRTLYHFQQTQSSK